MNTTEFVGKTALITGAGSGIGKAIAVALAERGAHALLSGRTPQRLYDVENALRTAGLQATALPGDICDNAWMARLRAHPDCIDILIHGAAGFAPYGPLEQRSDEEINTVLNTNLIAALRLSAALLPGMKRRNDGMLMFLGSRAASLGAANQVLYATAKAGLEGLVKSLVVENAFTGINAHLLELGYIDTERTREAMTEKARATLCARTPAGRAGTTDDVVASVCFLLSQEASFLRGLTLPVTGGFGLGLIMPKPPTSPL